MHPHLLLLQKAVECPLQNLLRDISRTIESKVGETELLPDDSQRKQIFLDDIVEERLIINAQSKEVYVVYRVFVNSKDYYENNYVNVGWMINEGMPVCNLCRQRIKTDAEKIHCFACGNIFCSGCCSLKGIVQGLEQMGELICCNLCNYGQELVVPVTNRKSPRFEISNLPELRKGLQQEIQVIDTQNQHNHNQGIAISSICLTAVHYNPELTALKSTAKPSKRLSLDVTVKPDNEPTDSSITPSRIMATKPAFHSELENLEDPPILCGWLKIRETNPLETTWKTRYCVVIRGFLYIYMDKLEIPPYGLYLKGQIGLGGYRVTTELPSYLQLELQRGGGGGSGHLEQVNAMGLKYHPDICSYETTMLLARDLSLDPSYFIEGSSNSTSNLTYFQLTGSPSPCPLEVYFEANNYDDRMTWLLTIQHHIKYIELKASQVTLVMMALNNNNGTTNKPLHPPLAQKPQKSNRSSFVAAEGHKALVEEPPIDQRLNPHLPDMRLLVKRLLPGASSNSSKPTYDFEEMQLKPWKQLLLSTEEEIFSGYVCKPKTNQKKRLVFVKHNHTAPSSTTLPFHTRDETTQKTVAITTSTSLTYTHRLLYIDLEKMIIKGQIQWLSHSKPPKVRKVDDRCFEILDYQVRKAYLFYPYEDSTVNQWIQVFEAVNPQPH